MLIYNLLKNVTNYNFIINFVILFNMLITAFKYIIIFIFIILL